jgi:hypothetical protein
VGQAVGKKSENATKITSQNKKMEMENEKTFHQKRFAKAYFSLRGCEFSIRFGCPKTIVTRVNRAFSS